MNAKYLYIKYNNNDMSTWKKNYYALNKQAVVAFYHAISN